MSTLRRGQTLVMMALTCLLLTMMIMMTISIGSKIKEKMELQTMADAAAYSNAVATARTFNAVSMMNRVGIAHVVGVLAIQSLVSWATFYHSTLYHAARNYRFFQIQFAILVAACCIPFSPCSGFCACAVQGVNATRQERSNLNIENTLFEALFRALDIQAAFEAVAYLTSCDFLHYIGQLPVLYTLNNFIDNQDGADRLTNTSRAGTKYNELRVDGQPDRHNKDEIGLPWGFGIPPKGAIIAINPLYSHHAFAAMGSRLHPFITGRIGLIGTAAMLITTRLLLINNPSNGVSLVTGIGSGYVSLLPGQQHGISFPPLAWFSRFMSADDHGMIITVYIGQLPCPIVRVWFGRPYAELWASQAGGMHRGSNWTDSFHWLGGLFRSYPWFMDYHFVRVTDESDIYGQPKNFGIVRRDYSARPTGNNDPYNPLFRFNYGTGSGLDLAKAGGALGQQQALGTGVTYYHRGNNALGYHSGVEPPNFFNPFWRAGLSRIDVDDQGINGDFQSTFPGPATDSFNGLRSNGFKGWQ